MVLQGGDVWTGLDTLRVTDEATGETIIADVILTDMDISAARNEITMSVSRDISNQNEDNRIQKAANDD